MSPEQEQLNELNTLVCDLVAEQRRLEEGQEKTPRQTAWLLRDAAMSMRRAKKMIETEDYELAAATLHSFVIALEQLVGPTSVTTQ